MFKYLLGAWRAGVRLLGIKARSKCFGVSSLSPLSVRWKEFQTSKALCSGANYADNTSLQQKKVNYYRNLPWQMTNGNVGKPSRESLHCSYSMGIKRIFPFMAAPQNLTKIGAPHFFIDVKTMETTLKRILLCMLVFCQSDPSTTALPCSYGGTSESICYQTLEELE